MKIPKPYFKNVPDIGDLEFKYCFYYFERPILFVCMDTNSSYYLCSCYEIAPNVGWVIAKTPNDLLLKMIYNKISLADVFKQCNDKYVAIWEKTYEYEHIKKITNFNSDILPMPDAYLDMEDNEYEDFIAEIKHAVECRKSQYSTEYDTEYDTKSKEIMHRFDHINISVEYDIEINIEYDTKSKEIMHRFDDVLFKYENDIRHDSKSYEDLHNNCVEQDEEESNIPVKYDTNTNYSIGVLLAA